MRAGEQRLRSTHSRPASASDHRESTAALRARQMHSKAQCGEKHLALGPLTAYRLVGMLQNARKESAEAPRIGGSREAVGRIVRAHPRERLLGDLGRRALREGGSD